MEKEPEWYYSRVPEHFRQWPFEQSVKLLINNYNHLLELYDIEKKGVAAYAKEAADLRKQLFNLQIQQVAQPATIDQLNKMFGTDIPNPDSN